MFSLLMNSIAKWCIICEWESVYVCVYLLVGLDILVDTHQPNVQTPQVNIFVPMTKKNDEMWQMSFGAIVCDNCNSALTFKQTEKMISQWMTFDGICQAIGFFGVRSPLFSIRLGVSAYRVRGDSIVSTLVFHTAYVTHSSLARLHSDIRHQNESFSPIFHHPNQQTTNRQTKTLLKLFFFHKVFITK